MKIYLIKNTNEIPNDLKNLSLVLGLFDGVHLGHQGLIKYAYENSKGNKLGVLTFDKALKDSSFSLMNLKDKEIELSKLPIDYLFVLMCDENLKRMSHEDFLNNILDKFKPHSIFCGPDFRFGYKALGDVEYLKSHFEKVSIFSFVEDEFGNKISSSYIKRLIHSGEISLANKFLTRPYKICGNVVSGLHNGHELGFPTANILPSINYVLPNNGVYFTKVVIDGEEFIAVTNVGIHPTIDKLENPIIESHILDCKKDLYNKKIDLYIYKKERDEITFKNLDELKSQISKDKENCIKYFQNLDLHK